MEAQIAGIMQFFSILPGAVGLGYVAAVGVADCPLGIEPTGKLLSCLDSARRVFFHLQSGPSFLPVEVAAMSSKFWLWAAAIVVLSGWSAAAERLPTPAEADDSVSDQIATLISQLD